MEEVIKTGTAFFILLMSMIGFALMGIDKRRAVKKAWRISEKTLILQAFLGGGIGSLAGMYLFRHKTKHTKFIILLPMAALVNLLILLYISGVIKGL